MTKEVMREELDSMTKSGFFDNSNLAIIVFFEYFMPDLDLWTLNYVVYENLYLGWPIMTPLQSYAFKPNIQETSSERVGTMCDSLGFIISFLLLALCVFDIWKKVRGPENKSFTIMRIIKFPYIMIAIVFCAHCYIVTALINLKNDSGETLSGANNLDYNENFYWYHGITYAQFLGIICIFAFLLRWMRIFSCTQDLIFVIKKSTYPILSFLLFAILLVICAFIFMFSIFGSYQYAFRHLWASIVEVLDVVQFSIFSEF